MVDDDEPMTIKWKKKKKNIIYERLEVLDAQ